MGTMPPAEPHDQDTPRTWVDELRVRFGQRALDALVRQCGGKRVYVPRQPAPGHRLIRILGAQAATWLADAWGGTTIDVPTGAGARHRAVAAGIRARIMAGQSNSAIAADLGISSRTVSSHRRKVTGDRGQVG